MDKTKRLRKRVERTRNGKYAETKLVEKIQNECTNFVKHICAEVAPEKDIMDLEQIVLTSLGYPFALELMHYSAFIDNAFKNLDKILDEMIDVNENKDETG